ncbi:MAG: DUF2259 domain-containing protein [Leptolyngbyaceae cyanobacterium bins.349]|nr:DUF2259 domain-containing protein [Leptolyngbyaceae cyanobacterium bins.349]
MHRNFKRTKQSLSSLLVVVVLAACAQGEMTSSKVDMALSASPSSQASVKVSESKESAQATPTIATFQTQPSAVGFSADGRYFMHLESWRDKGAGIPHAAIQIVDVAASSCVTNGCLRTRFTESQANQSIAAAEKDLLQKTQSLRQDLQLSAPVAGKTLPVLTRSRSANGTEVVTVQLPNNQPLQLTLQQKQVASVMAGGTAPKDQAAMQLNISYGNQARLLGSLVQMQDWTLEFSIREVQLAPDGKSVAVLLTAAERAFEGTLGRTIVQSFTL